ncbi:HD domain-containing phosphohydrolase [Niveibacterium sp. SC-1]|uniref:HD-GYP domain-containing protein n=1 Tax=Niveibacterium sp. SC-1 TaxID=3135646 RepID=UPI00311DE4F0
MPSVAENANARPTILVVDDIPENLEVMHHILGSTYRVRMASSGRRALDLAECEPPDLLLLDVSMPDLDGYAVCRAFKAQVHLADIPVIFVTANATDNNEQVGLACGAVDYVSKPFNPALLLARIKNHLELKAAGDRLRAYHAELEREVERRTHALVVARDGAILAMASLAEARDDETGNHLRRTQGYVRVLAEDLARQPGFADVMSTSYIEMLSKSAPLHDIGKIGIPDEILRKAGKFTHEDRAIMQGHPGIGRRAIEKAEQALGEPIEFLTVAKEIVYGHHEKWDGSGYPQGLSGTAIPLSARLMALADVYDALISARVYKPAMPHAEAAAIIRAGSGVHFDPAVVAAFDRCEARFRRIAHDFSDSDTQARRLEVA